MHHDRPSDDRSGATEVKIGVDEVVFADIGFARRRGAISWHVNGAQLARLVAEFTAKWRKHCAVSLVDAFGGHVERVQVTRRRTAFRRRQVFEASINRLIMDVPRMVERLTRAVAVGLRDFDVNVRVG